MNTINKILPPALKICGLTRAQDVRECERYGVDFIGFNFFAGSKRGITPEVARGLAGHVTQCQMVGVFVNHSLVEIEAICAAVPQLDVVQLHGHESLSLAKQVQLKTGKSVWKALSVTKREDIDEANAWGSVAELVLLDGVQPGSGQEFDWQWLSQHRPSGAWGLAGGIQVANVGRALSCRPTLIDIASGAEQAPGIKDAALLARLASSVSEARNGG